MRGKEGDLVKTFILVFLAFLMMSSQVYAGWIIYGSGSQPCGRYIMVLDGYQKKIAGDAMDYLDFMGWLSGFATSQSLQSDEDVLRGKNSDAITAWLENYCREHPSDDFLTASQKLLNALKER